MIRRLGWDGAVVLAAGLAVAGAVLALGPRGVGHWVVLVLFADAAYLATAGWRAGPPTPSPAPDPRAGGSPRRDLGASGSESGVYPHGRAPGRAAS